MHYKVHPDHPEPAVIAEAAGILQRGGLVAFPTETVYGLGANALDQAAVARIFSVKERPADNPLIVHVASLSQAGELARTVPEPALRLMEAFWPGPLTLVLPAFGHIPAVVTAGLDTVALRMPDHPVALALIAAAGVPVAAPSANRSGKPSPTTAAHVLADLAGRIDMVLDGGNAAIGVESTVLDMTAPVPLILRPGGVTREDLAEVIGETLYHPAARAGIPENPPRSPGMKYTHYAPEADVYLLMGGNGEMVATAGRLIRRWHREGKRVGLLASVENLGGYLSLPDEPDHLAIVGSREDLGAIAQNLYGALRSCDHRQVDVVLAETFPERGLGVAIMNRLHRAAAGRVAE